MSDWLEEFSRQPQRAVLKKLSFLSPVIKKISNFKSQTHQKNAQTNLLFSDILVLGPTFGSKWNVGICGEKKKTMGKTAAEKLNVGLLEASRSYYEKASTRRTVKVTTVLGTTYNKEAPV